MLVCFSFVVSFLFLLLSPPLPPGGVVSSLAAVSISHVFSISQSSPLFNPTPTSTPQQIIPSIFMVVVIQVSSCSIEYYTEIYKHYPSNHCSPLLPPSSSDSARPATTRPASLPPFYKTLHKQTEKTKQQNNLANIDTADLSSMQEALIFTRSSNWMTLEEHTGGNRA